MEILKGLWANILKPSVSYLWHVIGGSVTGAILPTIYQSALDGHLTVASTVSTIVAGLVGALVGYGQHSNNQLVALGASQITPDMQKAIDQKVSDAITNAIQSKPQTPKAGMVLALLGLMSLTPVLANPIGVPLNPGPNGEDALVMAPLGALEFNPSNSSNYGLAFSESLAFAHVTMADDSHVAIDPYLFVGLFGAANIGGWVNSNGGEPWTLDYGVMVGLPKLDATLPEVAFSAKWNSEVRGSAVMMINVAFPVDILPDVLCRKINL